MFSSLPGCTLQGKNLKKHWFWSNLEIKGAAVPMLVTDQSQIWLTRATPQYMSMCQISTALVYCVSLEWCRKKQIPFRPYFQLHHTVVRPPRSTQLLLNIGAQLHTLPYPTTSEPVPYWNRLHGKVTSTNPTVKKCDRQTKTEKHQTFLPRVVHYVQASTNLT